MRLALINPPLFNNIYHFFPIGLGYIAASLEEKGIDYDFIDMRLENWDSSQLIHYLKGRPAYDCFAIGGLISSFNNIKEVCYRIKETFPMKHIVLGGKISKVNTDILFDNLNPSYVIDGDGEESFCLLLESLSSNSVKCDEIPGLIYRDKQGKIICNPTRMLIDVNRYHIPYHRFPMERYISRSGIQSNGLKSLNMISSRGCPFECTFCNFSDGISGLPLRLYDVSQLEKEITHFKTNLDMEHIFWNDDVFAMNTRRLKEMGNMLHRLGIRYSISMRLDSINEERMSILETTGCQVLMVGVESPSPKIAKIIDKRMDTKKIQKNIELCQNSSIIVSFNFITGYVGETEKTLNETFEFLIKNRILYTSMYATAYPGTKLYEMVRDKIDDEEKYVYKLSNADLQTDYVLNMTELPEKRLKRIRDKMIVYSALNSFTKNRLLQMSLLPFFKLYWTVINVNSSRISWLRHATDLINWIIIKPIFKKRIEKKRKIVN